MRKLFISILCLLSAVSVSAQESSDPVIITASGIRIMLTEEGATILDGTVIKGDLRLPDILKYNDRDCRLIGIGDEAFKNDVGLKSVFIPAGVKTIGSQAFAGCTNLRTVICMTNGVPSTAADAFADAGISQDTLYVNITYEAAFRDTAPWSGFGRIEGVGVVSGIDNPTSVAAEPVIFDLNGRRQHQLQRGVNLIRKADGSVRKVMVR